MPLLLKVSAMLFFFSILDNFSIVLVVLKDVRMFVILNSLVMMLVSFPVYVKVTHFCLFSVVFCSMWFGLCLFWCLYVCILIRGSYLCLSACLTCILYLQHMNVPTKKWFSES
jgi:hypothetical protein